MPCFMVTCLLSSFQVPAVLQGLNCSVAAFANGPKKQRETSFYTAKMFIYSYIYMHRHMLLFCCCFTQAFLQSCLPHQIWELAPYLHYGISWQMLCSCCSSLFLKLQMLHVYLCRVHTLCWLWLHTL